MTDLAHVFKAGRLAAHLTRTPRGTEFGYDTDYLNARGPAVASTLPLTADPLLTPAGAVPPFFAGLLPEGRRLTNLQRALKTSADDELSLLVAVGADPIGDVQVGEAVTPPAPQTALSPQRGFSELSFTELLADAGMIDPAGIAGVQEKVSARMIAVPVARANERYILKLDPPEYPHLVENEHYFLRLARRAGMRTAAARIVHDRDERPGLLVTRFDRIASADGIRSLAVEDACQALGRWPADKYNVTMESAASALIALCAAKPIAALELFTQVAFAWITGNGDLHAKNLSVLQEGNSFRVSPAYDLPSTVPYGDVTAALRMGGRTSNYSRRYFRDFASELGLPAPAADARLDHLLAATSAVDADLEGGAIPFDSHRLADLRRHLAARRRMLAA